MPGEAPAERNGLCLRTYSTLPGRIKSGTGSGNGNIGFCILLTSLATETTELSGSLLAESRTFETKKLV